MSSETVILVPNTEPSTSSEDKSIFSKNTIFVNRQYALDRLETVLNYYKIRLIDENLLTELNYNSSIYRHILLNSWKLDHPDFANQFQDWEINMVFERVLALHFGHINEEIPDPVCESGNQSLYCQIFAP